MKESLAAIARDYLGHGKITSPRELAEALCRCGELLDLWPNGGLKLVELRRLVTKAVRSRSYRTFGVAKSSGGCRTISAPVGRLKDIQRAINLLLQAKANVTASANGFVEGRSVVDNARPHVGCRVVANFDIEDFFPSVTKRMVREALKREMGGYFVSHEAVNLMCSLVTMPDSDGHEALPQGAPSSPMVSNLVLARLDRRLERFASERGLAYTRYADDITLSGTTFTPGAKSWVEQIVSGEGFRLNRAKIKELPSDRRQSVTGVTVNEKLNVGRDYMRHLRVCLHLWESRGYAEAATVYRRDFRGGEEVNFRLVLRGKINYIGMVKGRKDPVFLRYMRRLIALEGKGPRN